MRKANHEMRKITNDVIELRNQEKIRTLGEKETEKYLGILKANTIKEAEMKEKNLKSFLWRIKKETKPGIIL